LGRTLSGLRAAQDVPYRQNITAHPAEVAGWRAIATTRKGDKTMDITAAEVKVKLREFDREVERCQLISIARKSAGSRRR
jgi:hypothetical protein